MQALDGWPYDDGGVVYSLTPIIYSGCSGHDQKAPRQFRSRFSQILAYGHRARLARSLTGCRPEDFSIGPEFQFSPDACAGCRHAPLSRRRADRAIAGRNTLAARGALARTSATSSLELPKNRGSSSVDEASRTDDLSVRQTELRILSAQRYLRSGLSIAAMNPFPVRPGTTG
jgi:hypothetical protein